MTTPLACELGEGSSSLARLPDQGGGQGNARSASPCTSSWLSRPILRSRDCRLPGVGAVLHDERVAAMPDLHVTDAGMFLELLEERQ
jgi:hypothetical protein